MERQVYLTPEGLVRLEAELEHLRTIRRQEVADQISRAKELGGTVNNAEYDDAKNEQAFVEGRILTLENLISNAVIIQTEASDRVNLGSTITVRYKDGEETSYTLVGSAEADPSQGRISNESPMGRSLLDRGVGEEVEVLAPGGSYELTILKVS